MVWVSPEDDIEFRQVELLNLGSQALSLELISAFEPTLADARADEAHPAFSQLFIEARADVAQQALYFERRPRLASEEGLHMAHFIAEGGAMVSGLRCQVDRQRWMGRNRVPWAPRAGLDAWGSTALNTGLDPVCVLAAQLHIAPGAKARLCFATAASSNLTTLQAVVDKYRQPSHIERAQLIQLGQQRGHVVLYGALRAAQPLRHRLVAQAQRQQRQHLAFTRRQPQRIDTAVAVRAHGCRCARPVRASGRGPDAPRARPAVR